MRMARFEIDNKDEYIHPSAIQNVREIENGITRIYALDYSYWEVQQPINEVVVEIEMAMKE